MHAGDVAGTQTPAGYIAIGVDGSLYQAHVLAWFYVHGVWPEDEIDHIDVDGTNNRFDNLRPSTSGQNKTNTRVRIDNTTGFKGVSARRGSIGFQAKIQHNKQQIHLGYFRTPQEAHAAYAAKARELFGEYAKVA
jgi:hypothetical protein